MIKYSCFLQDLITAEAAKEAGPPQVYWQTHQTNATAMRRYDKVAVRSGFIVYRHEI